MSLDKSWHLASTEDEIKITEFELQLWRVYYGFMRWQEECEKMANGDELSSDELAVLHVIRMKDRPKTIADIGRLLNRDNPFSINYNINKLHKMGLVEKLETATKKQYQYRVTDKGRKNTDDYTAARQSILFNEFSKDLKDIDLEKVTNGLMKLKSIYEEAVRVASTYKPSDNNKISPKKQK
jgi:predicted MarR family transcription regulator